MFLHLPTLGFASASWQGEVRLCSSKQNHVGKHWRRICLDFDSALDESWEIKTCDKIKEKLLIRETQGVQMFLYVLCETSYLGMFKMLSMACSMMRQCFQLR